MQRQPQTHPLKTMTNIQSEALLSALRAQTPLLMPLPPAAGTLPDLSGEVAAAHALWQRFAPFLAQAFADTEHGVIESPLRPIPLMQAALNAHFTLPEHGMLYLKTDDALPVAGSVKARGGIFEVLKFAEKIAGEQGLLQAGDDYTRLAGLRDFFGQFHIIVGSTGNLGLSIGTISAALGFRVTVHMSADARAWKKEKLRAFGVTVIEHAAAYETAVAAGRLAARQDAYAHFVDDEDSQDLLVGYATAGEPLAAQLAAQNIIIGTQRPLYVYLPCGVGGAPAGIAYGLRQIFGNHVHCLLAEPCAAPCMALALGTGDTRAVTDIGLDGQTIADGLAVGRASKLAATVLAHCAEAAVTVRDEDVLRYLALLWQQEGYFVEPSAAAGFAAYVAQARHCPPDAVHVVWSTGGGMVPAHERTAYLQQGQSLLANGQFMPAKTLGAL